LVVDIALAFAFAFAVDVVVTVAVVFFLRGFFALGKSSEEAPWGSFLLPRFFFRWSGLNHTEWGSRRASWEGGEVDEDANANDADTNEAAVVFASLGWARLAQIVSNQKRLWSFFEAMASLATRTAFVREAWTSFQASSWLCC
jgi:hypothetical protein